MDGSVLPAVVWSAGQDSSEISYLQGLEPLSGEPRAMNIQIDQNLLSHDLQALSGISAAPAPAVTRIVFSSTDLRGRDLVKNWCVQAGLAVREDPVGKTFARWP